MKIATPHVQLNMSSGTPATLSLAAAVLKRGRSSVCQCHSYYRHEEDDAIVVFKLKCIFAIATPSTNRLVLTSIRAA